MTQPNQLLTSKQVIELGIVAPKNTRAIRPTTIDATIGSIITKGGLSSDQTVTISPRGIAWITSQERFNLPNDVTGITTLRTTWTRKGILTLTVGIVDPGYDGYLSTAVINFSKNEFTLTKGDTFFRTAFFKHEETEGIERSEEEQDYKNSVVQDAAAFSDTFLTIDTLASELVPKMFGLPRWGVLLALFGLLIALFALVLPPAAGLIQEIAKKNARIEVLERDAKGFEIELEELRKEISTIRPVRDQDDNPVPNAN